MKIDPFGGPDYQGRMVTGRCDGCYEDTTYEEDAYGQDFLVLCPTCKGSSGLLDPTDAPDITLEWHLSTTQYTPQLFGLFYTKLEVLLGTFTTRDDAVGYAYNTCGFTDCTQFTVRRNTC